MMKRWALWLVAVAFVTGSIIRAEDAAITQTDWVDVTREVAANPAETGGWVKDDAGKVFRSADGNTVKIQHGTFGIFKIDLPGAVVYRLEGDKEVVQEGATLMQRDAGQTLVVKTKEYKFKVQFTEKIQGMKSITGIKGM